MAISEVAGGNLQQRVRNLECAHHEPHLKCVKPEVSANFNLCHTNAVAADIRDGRRAT